MQQWWTRNESVAMPYSMEESIKQTNRRKQQRKLTTLNAKKAQMNPLENVFHSHYKKKHDWRTLTFARRYNTHYIILGYTKWIYFVINVVAIIAPMINGNCYGAEILTSSFANEWSISFEWIKWNQRRCSNSSIYLTSRDF